MASHAANDLRSKIVFETEDLIFREMGVADLEFVAGMLADPQVMESFRACIRAKKRSIGFNGKKIAMRAVDTASGW